MAMNFVKGMGIGVMVGGMTGAAGCAYVMNHRKSLRKSVSKTLKNVSQLVDNMGGIF